MTLRGNDTAPRLVGVATGRGACPGPAPVLERSAGARGAARTGIRAVTFPLFARSDATWYGAARAPATASSRAGPSRRSNGAATARPGPTPPISLRVWRATPSGPSGSAGTRSELGEARYPKDEKARAAPAASAAAAKARGTRPASSGTRSPSASSRCQTPRASQATVSA